MNKLFILLAAFVMSCGNKVNDSSQNMAVEENIKTGTTTEVTQTQKSMLLGDFEKAELQQAPFDSWFSPRYENFSPNSEAMNTITENIDEYEIKLFMGTWCGDSKRETPKFLKILDQANYDYDKLELIAVDYNKQTPSNREEELEIKRVPTIVFFKNGQEVNRFVEYPQGESIEEDIAKIVSGKEYKNSYAD